MRTHVHRDAEVRFALCCERPSLTLKDGRKIFCRRKDEVRQQFYCTGRLLYQDDEMWEVTVEFACGSNGTEKTFIISV